ncbi:Fc.00g003310.m01.CDS01 [Cosmosporella sp. VM-42]
MPVYSGVLRSVYGDIIYDGNPPTYKRRSMKTKAPVVQVQPRPSPKVEQQNSIFPTELPPRPTKARFQKVKNVINRLGLARKKKSITGYQCLDDHGDWPQPPPISWDLESGDFESQPPDPIEKAFTALLGPNPGPELDTKSNKKKARKQKTWNKPCPYLPGNISYKMVDNWTQAYRNGRDRSRPEVHRWGTHNELRQGVQVHAYHKAKIAKGHLLLRTQTVLYRRAAPCGSTASPVCLIELFNQAGWSLNLCPHTALRSSRFKALLCPCSDKEHTSARKSSIAKHTCAWTHKQPCPLNCASTVRLEKVSSCSACYTDICISAKSVESSEWNAVIATTWKDLGSGRDEQDIIWQSHMTHEIRHLRTGTDPSAFKAYEDEESSLGEGKRWFTQIPEQSLRMFTRMKPA